VKLELASLPADNIALMTRIRYHIDQVHNLSRASPHDTNRLRRRWYSFCAPRRAWPLATP
jgi:hypothetical protein